MSERLEISQEDAQELYTCLKAILSYVNRTADQYWKPSYAKWIERADRAIVKAKQ